MNLKKVVAVVLIVGGVVALIQGGFTYTRETHDVKLGPMELEWKEKERVQLPLWLGVAAIGAGTLLLVLARRSG